MAVKYLLIFMILAAYFQGKSYQKFISKVDSKLNSITLCKKENTKIKVKDTLSILHTF